MASAQKQDPLVDAFGAVCSSSSELDSAALALAFHEAARAQAVEAFSGPDTQAFEPLELETRLWDLVARSLAPGGHDVRQVMLEWAQANLKEPQEPDSLRSIKWMHTKSQKRGDFVVSELDLDAPLRQARPLANEDVEADETVFRYIFELLLAGDKDQASNACAETNNWLTKSAISASSLPLFVEASKGLTKAKIGKYEAGVYGLLSGDLVAVAPLCDTWESLLLAHMNAGASLESFERAVSRDHTLALQGSDWRRQIALALAQKRFGELASNLISETRTMVEAGQAEDALLVRLPWLARIILHLELVQNPSAVDEFLVQLYVEYLCLYPELLSERLAFVPAYVRLLDAEGRVKVYGHVLAQITSPEERARQLQLAAEFGIDMRPVLLRCVELNFAAYTETGDSSRVLAAVQWLVDAELWDDACDTLVLAYERLLDANDRLGASILGTEISAEYVIKHTLARSRTRLYQYAKLATAFVSLDAWRSFERQGPGWRTQAAKIVGQAIEAVQAALSFDVPGLRQQYVPLVVYDLLSVLSEAESVNRGYAKTALGLAVRIADENEKLYELFDGQRLMAELVGPYLATVE